MPPGCFDASPFWSYPNISHGLTDAAPEPGSAGVADAPLPNSPARGAVGTTTDILTGVVKDESGQPVADAIVEATSLETRILRTAKTDPRGRYILLFPDGDGQYRLIVRAIGKTPIMRTIARQADEDRLVTNITLGQPVIRLDEIVARGQRGPRVDPGGGPPTPGSTERNLNANLVAKLPLDASDLTILATLAPGVVSVSGTDTSAAGFSVAGQRPTANSVTLDGLTFGGASVPQDAVRNTRVITNSYDVARGQFSGGVALDAAKALLTPEQWNYLPERIRSPRGFGGPGGGEQRGERRRPPAR